MCHNAPGFSLPSWIRCFVTSSASLINCFQNFWKGNPCKSSMITKLLIFDIEKRNEHFELLNSVTLQLLHHTVPLLSPPSFILTEFRECVNWQLITKLSHEFKLSYNYSNTRRRKGNKLLFLLLSSGMYLISSKTLLLPQLETNEALLHF